MTVRKNKVYKLVANQRHLIAICKGKFKDTRSILKAVRTKLTNEE